MVFVLSHTNVNIVGHRNCIALGLCGEGLFMQSDVPGINARHLVQALSSKLLPLNLDK